VIRDLNLPDEVKKEFPKITEKAISERKQEIIKLVREKFKCDGILPRFIIRQGQATKEVMKFAATEKMDLIIVGRKNEKISDGVLVQRLARRVGCSLLIIPKGQKLKFGKVLVPIDFSSYSKMALEKAVDISNKSSQDVQIIVQNVFNVPSGYHYAGKTYEEFAAIMKKHAQSDYENFIQDLDLSKINIRTTYTLDKEDDVIDEIHKKSKKIKADLIIIGAKGRTSATALFIGSKAEKLLHLDTKIPVLVVRPKGKRAGIIEYLQDL
jgi:nucleotide-binding universal stress UspA family protein